MSDNNDAKDGGATSGGVPADGKEKPIVAQSPWAANVQAMAGLGVLSERTRAGIASLAESSAKPASESDDVLIGIVMDHIDAVRGTYSTTPAGEVLPPQFSGVKYSATGKPEVHVIAMHPMPATMTQVAAVWMLMIAERDFDAFVMSCESWVADVDENRKRKGGQMSAVTTLAYDVASDRHISAVHLLTPKASGEGQDLIDKFPLAKLEYCPGYPMQAQSPLYGPYLTIRSMYGARAHGEPTMSICRKGIVSMLTESMPFLRKMSQKDYTRDEFIKAFRNGDENGGDGKN